MLFKHLANAISAMDRAGPRLPFYPGRWWRRSPL